MTTWTVEERVGGGVVVTWGRKRKPFDSEDEALRFIRKNRSGADRVVRVQKDGYTEPLTRKRWRRSRSEL
jgi:hypothetical protein